MKIKIRGEMTLPELRQCILEQLAAIEDSLLIRHSKDATIYINPTNGLGKPVTCRDERGEVVSSIICEGPYASAALEYGI